MKHFFVLLIFVCGLAWFQTANSQVESKDADVTDQVDETTFTFEMPPEYQTKLPQEAAKEILKPKPVRKGWNLSFLGPIFKLLFYGMLAFAVAYILYLILNAVIAAKRSHVKADNTEEIPDIPVYQPDEETARVLMDDADQLAAQGKFAEAVHILLFRSIQDIEDKRPHHVKRSLTSREIAGLSILTPKAKDVFSQIGRLVENSFFGGKLLGVEDYELSKAAYKAFAFENVAHAKAVRSARSRR